MKADDELDERLGRMRKHFLVPPSESEILAEFDAAVVPLGPEYQGITNAFRHSLVSCLSTVAMPFALASASAQQSHFQRIRIAERIRARAYDWDDVQADKSAHSRMHEFIRSDEGRNAIIKDTCEFLLQTLNHGLESAAQELLQQGLVLLWTAFEVLYRDTFETFLNQEPTKITSLTNHPATRKRFEAERLPLDTLVQHGFDLSSRLGSVLVTQQDFSDLRTIKAVYTVLFSASVDLHHALAHRDLWTLNQRRNLVVHRRGVIDEAYRDATEDSAAVGTRLEVTPEDFERSLNVVISSGTALARSFPARQ